MKILPQKWMLLRQYCFDRHFLLLPLPIIVWLFLFELLKLFTQNLFPHSLCQTQKKTQTRIQMEIFNIRQKISSLHIISVSLTLYTCMNGAFRFCLFPISVFVVACTAHVSVCCLVCEENSFKVNVMNELLSIDYRFRLRFSRTIDQT